MKSKMSDIIRSSLLGRLTKSIIYPKSNGDLNFENHKTGPIPANVFLLTHKCGNNYVQDVFQRSNKKLIQFQSDE
jgi:hypothetical protein